LKLRFHPAGHGDQLPMQHELAGKPVFLALTRSNIHSQYVESAGQIMLYAKFLLEDILLHTADFSMDQCELSVGGRAWYAAGQQGAKA
jgi:hypothetical protein